MATSNQSAFASHFIPVSSARPIRESFGPQHNPAEQHLIDLETAERCYDGHPEAHLVEVKVVLREVELDVVHEREFAAVQS